MANTQSMLATAVAGFLQRDPSTFLRGTGGLTQLLDAAGNLMLDAGGQPIMVPVTVTLDLLLQACNNSRLYAERVIDFTFAAATVTIPSVDLKNGASLDTAILTGTMTSVRVKKIITPFLGMADGTQYPVDLWTKKKWNDRIKRRFEGARPTDSTNYAFITDSPFVVIQNGNTVFVTPADSTAFQNNFPIYLDCLTWLPPYVNGTENDFLLDSCFDWMMYRSIYELNFFLKEDERVQIAEKLMTDSWNAVIKWNNELIAANVDDVDLD